MPVHVAKRGNKYCVVDPDGKLTGKCYSDRKSAVKQVQAINLSMRRQEGKPTPPAPKSKSALDLAAEERIQVLASELKQSHGAEQPAIVIMSDGTPEGTSLMLNGQTIAVKRVSFYSSNVSDHPYCDISMTIEESSSDGIVVEKTLTLRKESTSKALSAEKKLDPNAQVRNRGTVVFPSTHPKVTDNKDHFPINDADQARNALARVAQYSAAPKWWSGSLKQLQSAVRSAVKRKYKGINVTEANCKEGFALFHAISSFRWAREN